ncbi:putative zinc finger c2h2-type protein [Diaporthe ampelina]|uniref:Putative zinc finger c2h2-type protein n=1 Tax=Diaporthe ampelina TaxID=1214573 RepID=A0A0G2FM98_9PEZI|nr:putative zinc finger c2h2-type protein [Diaporthe ampelina]
MQSVKSPLNSAFHHLYANVTLAVIKKLLCSPVALDNPQEIATLFSGAAFPNLYKVLIRAADQLRVDCRLGLEYLRTVAPLQYGPEGAIGPYEGGEWPALRGYSAHWTSEVPTALQG